LLSARKRQLKPLLLDQSVLAGLGNIYTDEALYRAGLHPALRAHRLTNEQVRALHSAIRYILRLAIRRHGTSIDWIYPGGWMQKHLQVYGRAGEACRRCGTPIVALRVAQRGTHICPGCQPRDGKRRTTKRRAPYQP
ncbi:MAG: formamidopyrimidine-DNA glycosylase, partial [Phycisphaerae bacterium]|nr:formamidopyrimidine-DNA glycosylase [Phycisphaerae bacterium]